MGIYRSLSDCERESISAGVALAGHLTGLDGLPDLVGAQALYDALLPDLTRPHAATEALGYAFGNLFLEQTWLCWAMMLDDEFGDEVAIVVRDRALGCSPLSMMRHRLEDGEPCDLAELLDATVRRLRQLGQQAASAS